MNEKTKSLIPYQNLIDQGYTNAAQHPAVDPTTIPAELHPTKFPQHDHEPSDETLIDAGRLASAYVDGTSGVVMIPKEVARHEQAAAPTRY